MKSLDILICCHSKDPYHDRLLRRALHSLIEQTYQDFRTILVLDECWPNSKREALLIGSLLKDFRVIEKPKKEGLAKAKNFGLAYCNAELIMYLDADDSLEPTKIEEQINFIRENPQYDIIGTLAWDTYNPGTDQEYKKPSCFAEGQYDEDWKIRSRLRDENVFTHGSLALKKSLLDKIGGYPEDRKYLGMEDWVMLKNAIFNFNTKAFIIPKRLYNYSMNTSVER